MEWHNCPDCEFSHPWLPGERRCPNIGLTREQVMQTVNRISSGAVVDISKEPLSERKRMQARERMRRMRERQKLGKEAVGEGT